MGAFTTRLIVESAPHDDPGFIWDRNRLGGFAGNTLPPDMLGQHDAMLRGDQAVLWLRWFFESLASPRVYVDDPTKSWVNVYADVLPRIRNLYSGDMDSDQEDLAKAVSNHLFSEVQRQRLLGRSNATKAQKVDLIQSATPPRCYLCGFEFSLGAIQRFLRQRGAPVPTLPPTLDVFRPRGRKPHELGIEVEHIMPVASGGGGGSNLKLACGWCNRAKGAKTSIYESAFTTRTPKVTTPITIKGRRVSDLPEPFWIVRVIAFQKRCYAQGCTATLQNSELRVELKDFNGSPNPTNLRAVCAQHDSIATERFRDRAMVTALWS